MIQSDNGEFKSDAVEKYLHSVGGSRRVCCAYTPELMAVIERLWGTIHNMATALLIESGLSESYWVYAQAYAYLIYNNIPPTRRVIRAPAQSPNQLDGEPQSQLLYLRIFGCRA